VSIVWNDANHNPLGDVPLQSNHLGTLFPIQGALVKLNSDSGTGTLHAAPRYPSAREYDPWKHEIHQLRIARIIFI
jgi:hypothetical protein